MKNATVFVSVFSILMSIIIVGAQSLGECEDITNQALEFAGEACYGFNFVDAMDFEFQAVDEFTETGDIVALEEIR